MKDIKKLKNLENGLIVSMHDFIQSASLSSSEVAYLHILLDNFYRHALDSASAESELSHNRYPMIQRLSDELKKYQ